jgi:uncharacterized protein (TIRG00374 family)
VASPHSRDHVTEQPERDQVARDHVTEEPEREQVARDPGPASEREQTPGGPGTEAKDGPPRPTQVGKASETPVEATSSSSERRRSGFSPGGVALRMAGLIVTGFALYALWPGLLEVFSAWPRLTTLNPWWFAVMLVLEVGSFVMLWLLTGLAVRTVNIFLVATSQLVSNALGKVLPAGGATAGAAQLRMLIVGGMDATTATTGLTAVTLLVTAIPFGMPVFALPAVLGGAQVADGLAQALWIGLAAFVLMFVVGMVLLTTDRPLELIGDTAERFTRRVRRHRHGDRKQERRPDLGRRLVEERDLVRKALGERRWLALATAVGRPGLDYLALLAALYAVGVDPRPGLVVLAYAAQAVLAMIPITPGGLGFVEAGLTGTLTLAGVPAPAAVLSTLAYRLVSFWLPLPAGLWAGFAFRRRFGSF